MLTCTVLGRVPLIALLARYGLCLEWVALSEPIPGSYWGAQEAGLVGNRVLVRDDTPVHSLLHETCHYVCMDAHRRAGLNTDAGGDYLEENAVCYLQVLLADYLPRYGRERAWAEMDAWGYSFRFGSTRAWFEQDAEDARQWLLTHDLIDGDDAPTWRLRQD
jgi:hypothetical protein